MKKSDAFKNIIRLKDRRRLLRANATEAEKILWTHLRRNQLGYRFRRQYSIGNIIADFCLEQLKLIIEADGWTHESEKTQAKDRYKTKMLEAKGYRVIRFTNEQIHGDVGKVIEKIKLTIKEITDNCSA